MIGFWGAYWREEGYEVSTKRGQVNIKDGGDKSFPMDVEYYDDSWLDERFNQTSTRFKIRNLSQWLKSNENVQRLCWIKERCEQHRGKWGIPWKRVSAQNDLWWIFMIAKESGGEPTLDLIKEVIKYGATGKFTNEDLSQFVAIRNKVANVKSDVIFRILVDLHDKKVSLSDKIQAVKTCAKSIEEAEAKVNWQKM